MNMGKSDQTTTITSVDLFNLRDLAEAVVRVFKTEITTPTLKVFDSCEFWDLSIGRRPSSWTLALRDFFINNSIAHLESVWENKYELKFSTLRADLCTRKTQLNKFGQWITKNDDEALLKKHLSFLANNAPIR